MATKKNVVENKVAQTKVTFTVKTPYVVEEVYLCGSIDKLGAWDLKKALKCEYNPEKNEYTVSKLLPLGEIIEFKVLKGKSWDCVEKGYFNEEIQNRSILVEKGLNILIEVSNFIN